MGPALPGGGHLGTAALLCHPLVARGAWVAKQGAPARLEHPALAC